MEGTEENVRVIILDKKLETVVTSTTFDLTKAQSHAVAFAPCMEKVNELSKGLSIMDKENPSEIDAKMARINRLALVKVRGVAKVVKEELKSSLIIEGKLIDSLFGVVENTADLTEAEYAKIERFAENKEKERKLNLFNERVAYLSAVCENPSIYPLGDMEDADYNNLYEGLRLADQAKRDAQIKAENDRIAAEKQAEDDRIEAKRKADEEAEKQRLQNIRLKKEAEEKEIEAREIRYLQDTRLAGLLPFNSYGVEVDMSTLWVFTPEKYAEILADKKAAFEVSENARRDREAAAKKEKEIADAKLLELQAEKDKADALAKKELEKANKEKADTEAALAESNRLLKEKSDADAKAIRDKELADEIELQKGDKQRFDDLLQDIELLKYKNAGKFKTAKFKKIHDQMFEMFDKMIKHGHEKK